MVNPLDVEAHRFEAQSLSNGLEILTSYRLAACRPHDLCNAIKGETWQAHKVHVTR